MISAELLKYYREKNNLSIQELSKKINCPKKIITLWEDGIIKPKDKDIENLIKLYKIEKDELYKKEESKYTPIVVSIFLLIMGLILGIAKNNLTVTIILPIVLIIGYNMGIRVLREYQVSDKLNKEIPKSIFGMLLDIYDKKQRRKIYLMEANLITSSYLIFNMLFIILNLNELVLNFEILKDKTMNQLLLIILVYITLLIFTIVLEIIFGEKMVNSYKGEKEWKKKQKKKH